MKFRSPEGAAFFNLALSLCCLLGLAGSAFFLAKEQRDTDALVRRSQEVVSHVTQLQQLTLHAESTGRAYLLIADPMLLQRYEETLPVIDRELAVIRKLLDVDPAEAGTVDNVKRGLDTRYSFLSALMKMRTTQGLQVVATLASRGTGREEMAYVGSVLAELKNGQNSQLREYLTQRERLIVQLWLLTIAFVIAGVALAVWVYHQTRQANANRESNDRQKEYIARHDALTGLANRRYLQDRLESQIAEAMRRSGLVALMYLDLDGFKEVNDTFGHDSGDELLVDVARRLRNALREDDVVARLGGDEFVVSLPHLHSVEDVSFVANKLIEVLRAPYALDAGEVRISASLGVATYPRDGHTPKALLVAADRALYAAKTAGKNRFLWAGESLRVHTA